MSEVAERPVKAKKITLSAWADRHYDPAPSMWTLRQWVRDGQIYPPAEKVGKSYYVEPEARRITDSTPQGAMAKFLSA